MAEHKKLKLTELGRMTDAEFRQSQKIPVTVILDNIRSMHNVGSFFRTADAFRLKKIILCGLTARPPHRDIEKTALGATQTVSWEYAEDAVEALQRLKEQNTLICSMEQVSESILISDFKVNQNQEYAIVFGNEVKGVQQKVINQSDFCLEIPQYGTKHSLNVSVCGGVVLWHFTEQLSASINA